MDEIKNVAVIGCGQVGRRHIQGLGNSKLKLAVHVFDNSSKSIENCKIFINEIKDEIENIRFRFHNDLAGLGKVVTEYDLTIVASTAKARSEQIKSILTNINSKNFLLEKPLSQSPKELDELVSNLKFSNVWVNHFRRSIPWHQELREKYFKNQLVEVTISGPDVGIGCNVAHFVDLLNYWSEEVPINIDASNLNRCWHEAKREGFKEINGKLDIVFSKGSILRIISNPDLNDAEITGKNLKTGIKFSIDEQNAMSLIGEDEFNKGQMLFQSQLTGMIIDQLEQKGNCDLTPLNIASTCYRPVIAAMLSHWQATAEGHDHTTVPLT